MEIQARFTHTQINHSQDNDIHLVVSLKAPTLDWMEKRPKLCVLPVVDLSGSMQGDKLKYAKQSLLKLVDQLAEGDFAGLVAFESRVHVLVAPKQVTAQVKDELKKAIRNLRIMGGTNFSEGMMASLKLVAGLDLPQSFLKRVIMFTDGQPTEGVVNSEAILKMLNTNRGSVTVSAFGYGETNGGVWGGCDHDFLTAFSGQGNGNYAYVKNPDDALGAFGKELGGLLSTYATDLRLEIEPVKGHRVSEVITNVKHEEDVLGLVEIPISDIMSEETRHFVFKTTLAKQSKAFPRDTTVFNVKLTYSVVTEAGTKEVLTTEAKARVRFVREADAQSKADPTVEEIVALHQVIQTQLKAEEEAKKGRHDVAQGLMNEMARQVHTAGYVRVAAMAQNVSHRLGAEEYGTSSGFLRSLANGGTRAYGTSGLDQEAASLLEECDVSLGNSSMQHYQTSFRADVEPDPEPVVDQVQTTPPRVLPPIHDPRFQWISEGASSTLWTGDPAQPVTTDHVYIPSSTDKSE